MDGGRRGKGKEEGEEGYGWREESVWSEGISDCIKPQEEKLIYDFQLTDTIFSSAFFPSISFFSLHLILPLLDLTSSQGGVNLSTT